SPKLAPGRTAHVLQRFGYERTTRQHAFSAPGQYWITDDLDSIAQPCGSVHVVVRETAADVLMDIQRSHLERHIAGEPPTIAADRSDPDREAAPLVAFIEA